VFSKCTLLLSRYRSLGSIIELPKASSNTEMPFILISAVLYTPLFASRPHPNLPNFANLENCSFLSNFWWWFLQHDPIFYQSFHSKIHFMVSGIGLNFAFYTKYWHDWTIYDLTPLSFPTQLTYRHTTKSNLIKSLPSLVFLTNNKRQAQDRTIIIRSHNNLHNLIFVFGTTPPRCQFFVITAITHTHTHATFANNLGNVLCVWHPSLTNP